MPETKKRGRPPKVNPDGQVTENNMVVDVTSGTITNNFLYGTYYSGSVYESIFNCGVYDYFNKSEIEAVIKNPILHHETAIRLSELVYNKSGVVANSIDYCTSLMTLDKVVTGNSKAKKMSANKKLMKSVLKTINDKSFIRDALFTEMTHGIAFYYFETTDKKADRNKFLSDYEVDNIYEINELGINAAITSLPWQYTRIIGRKNNRYVLAFDLSYFDTLEKENLSKKLRKYPKEIVDAYNSRNTRSGNKNWVVLDSDKTMCGKIKARKDEPWGRSLIIAALVDVLYKDYWLDTKRHVLDDVNNQLIYETFPEGKEKGSSALTQKQQEAQHNTVKKAIQNKNAKGGKCFVSVSAGTKLDTIDISTDIFDSDNETNLNNDIATDLGISAALIGAMSTGTYSGNVNNLEMITAQLYTWVSEWAAELNHVINANIIKDNRNKPEVYYFPTSFVNRKEFFEMMKTLYTEAMGSLTFLIAASGVDSDIYLDTMESELNDGIFEKFKPHLTSYTITSEDTNETKPTTDNPTQNTVRSRNQNGNALPSPSD